MPELRDDRAAQESPGWLAGLARLVMSIFFRRVEVVGIDRVPRDGPVVFVVNHGNGLVDPVLVLGSLPRSPRFLAKAPLWRNPFLRLWLDLGRVIPVYRRQDPGFDPTKNEGMFARCHDVLVASGAIALFPEGQSHAESKLTELKTGAARIVLGLRAGRSVRVVPVGLTFDDRSRFRSCALVSVGESLEVLAEGEAQPEPVRELTDRIAAALGTVTLNFATWDQARLVERAVDVVVRPHPEVPGAPKLSERFDAARTIRDEYARLLERDPERGRALAALVGRYDRLLRRAGLRDDQVGARYEAPSVLRFVASSLGLSIVRLPLAAVGVALNYVPYRLAGWIAARFAARPDEPASWKLFGGVLVYPVTWGVEVAVAAWWGGWRWATAVALLGPIGGWVAMRFEDRLRLVAGEARAFLRLGASDRLVAELRRLRGEIARAIDAVAVELGYPGSGYADLVKEQEAVDSGLEPD